MENNSNLTESTEEIHKVYGHIPPAVEYTLFGISQFLIITGNLLVIVAVVLEKKLRKSSTNILIISLAVSDLLVGAYYITSVILWKEAVHLMVNHVICNVDGFIQLTSTGASVFTLIAIACDRFRAIVTPLKPKITRAQAGIMLAIAWICAMLYALYVPVMWELQTAVWQVGNETMVEDYCHLLPQYYPDGLIAMRQCDFYVLFLIPLIILVCLYAPMIYKLWFAKQPVSTTGGRKRRAIKMLAVVVIVFFLLWIPYYSVFFFDIYADDEQRSKVNGRVFLTFAICLNFANSWANPIIYGCFNENFRNAYKNTILCRIWSLSRRVYPSSDQNSDRSTQSQPQNPGQQPTATRNTLLTTATNTTSAHSFISTQISQAPPSFVVPFTTMTNA